MGKTAVDGKICRKAARGRFVGIGWAGDSLKSDVETQTKEQIKDTQRKKQMTNNQAVEATAIKSIKAGRQDQTEKANCKM